MKIEYPDDITNLIKAQQGKQDQRSDLLYQTNMTIKEVKDLLEIMETNDKTLVGVHFFSGSIMGPIKVTLDPIYIKSEDYIDITDYANA